MQPENASGHLEIARKPSNHYDEQMITGGGDRMKQREWETGREIGRDRERQSQSNTGQDRMTQWIGWRAFTLTRYDFPKMHDAGSHFQKVHMIMFFSSEWERTLCLACWGIALSLSSSFCFCENGSLTFNNTKQNKKNPWQTNRKEQKGILLVTFYGNSLQSTLTSTRSNTQRCTQKNQGKEKTKQYR